MRYNIFKGDDFMHPFGYDFSRIKSIQLNVTNNTFKFIVIILSLTPAIMFLVSIILYLSQAPVHSNENVYYPGSAEYNQFYFMFIFITVSITILMIIIGIMAKSSSGDYQVYLTDSAFLEPFIYMTSKRKNLYINDSVAIIHHLKKDRIEVINNEAKIQELKSNLLFWLDEDQALKVKVKNSEYGLSISYQTDYTNKRLLKQIKLKYDGAMNLIEYRETVTSRYGGNSNIQKMAKCAVVKYNTDVSVVIDRAIENQINREM